MEGGDNPGDVAAIECVPAAGRDPRVGPGELRIAEHLALPRSRSVGGVEREDVGELRDH